MSDKVRDALTYARDLLWDLLVQHEKGEINLGDENNRRDVDQCQRLCAQALQEIEGPEKQSD